MEWLQAFMIAGSTIGACWLMHKENKDLSKEIARESKDFHGRLCALEEKYIQIMQKHLDK
jgi:hypothetical protein